MTQKKSKKKNTTLRNNSKTRIGEAKVVNNLVEWLENNGWSIEKISPTAGEDIVAIKGRQKWIIEVKGAGATIQQNRNYFFAVLGQILQRMSDEKTKYSIAFPDVKPYRTLWANNLPSLAKERTKLGVLFVSSEGQVDEIS